MLHFINGTITIKLHYSYTYFNDTKTNSRIYIWKCIGLQESFCVCALPMMEDVTMKRYIVTWSIASDRLGAHIKWSLGLRGLNICTTSIVRQSSSECYVQSRSYFVYNLFCTKPIICGEPNPDSPSIPHQFANIRLVYYIALHVIDSEI